MPAVLLLPAGDDAIEHYLPTNSKPICWKVARIVGKPSGTTDTGNLKNDEVAVVHVKLRLWSLLRARDDIGRGRIPRDSNCELYIDRRCLLLGQDAWR